MDPCHSLVQHAPITNIDDALVSQQITYEQVRLHSTLSAEVNSPVVPFGKTAVSIAMCPWSTRVNARFCSAVGVPKCW